MELKNVHRRELVVVVEKLKYLCQPWINTKSVRIKDIVAKADKTLNTYYPLFDNGLYSEVVHESGERAIKILKGDYKGVIFQYGKIEFIRFTRNGGVDKRSFNYNRESLKGSFRNPVLLSGDVINVKHNLFTATTETLGEVTKPFVGLYTLFNIYENVTD